MAKTAARTKGKTEFVQELLGKNPHANTTAANEAWQAAGRTGSISATLVNKQRSTLGLTGNLRSKNKPKAEMSSTAKLPYTGKKRGRKPKSITFDAAMNSPFHSNGRKNELPVNGALLRAGSTGRHGALEEVEADIDRLLFKVMGLGGLTAIEESLRQTRRLLYGAIAGQ
jgi:hypothetical protein